MKRRLRPILAALCLVLALLPVTALAADRSSGYDGQDLPAAPTVDGNTWTVTPDNAQYTLDGAYGSIDGKTIHFDSRYLHRCSGVGPYQQIRRQRNEILLQR